MMNFVFQHGKGTVGVLRQTPIANLGEAPKALEREERMLDLGLKLLTDIYNIFVK